MTAASFSLVFTSWACSPIKYFLPRPTSPFTCTLQNKQWVLGPPSACTPPPGHMWLGVRLFSISPSPLVKVPGTKLCTWVAVTHPKALFLFDLCPFCTNTVIKLCLKGFISDPRGSCLWTNDAWSYSLCLLWWNAYIVQVMAYLTQKWPASWLHTVYFFASGQEFVLVLLFFFFLAFQGYWYWCQ